MGFLRKLSAKQYPHDTNVVEETVANGQTSKNSHFPFSLFLAAVAASAGGLPVPICIQKSTRPFAVSRPMLATYVPQNPPLSNASSIASAHSLTRLHGTGTLGFVE